MATPTYATVISQIDAYIVANGNNEITANVLNPILKVITDFANNTIGNLGSLTTTDTDTVVGSINSLKLAFNNLNNNGVQLLTGYDNPNTTPPPVFNYADFYMELDLMDDSPIQLWQWSGSEWTTYSSVYSKAEIDLIVTNIYAAIEDGSPLIMIDYPVITVAGTQNFTIPIGATARQVFNNKAQYFKETANNAYQIDTFTQVDNVVTLKKNTSIGNYICIFYQTI